MSAYPWKTIYSKNTFEYRKCVQCGVVFVSPRPTGDVLRKMYEKTTYHDQHYTCIETTNNESVKLISSYLWPEALVLDYGCGHGNFLSALKAFGLSGQGVEFCASVAQEAAARSMCPVATLEEFLRVTDNLRFDAIYLGDVLEHLPDPRGTLQFLMTKLKPNALIFIEVPLEENPSLVMYCTKIAGWIKRVFGIHGGNFPPHHLIRADAAAMKRFLQETVLDGKFLHWKVYETGWPYGSNGRLRNLIASLALSLASRKYFRGLLGNRCQAIIRVTSTRSLSR